MNSSPPTSPLIPAHARIIGLFILLALAAYTLPWLTGTGRSLSPGAYDLAEWVSLHPAARHGQPPLLPSLLLRLPLACLALITATAPLRLAGWLRGILVLAFAVALLPPIEFFTLYQNDPNYQQQFGLALVAFIGGSVGLSRVIDRWRLHLTVVFAGIAAVTGLIGISQSLALVQELGGRSGIGAGSIAFALANTAIGIGATWAVLRQTKTG